MLLRIYSTDFKTHLLAHETHLSIVSNYSGQLNICLLDWVKRKVVTILGGMEEKSHGDLCNLLGKVWPPSGKGMSSGLSKMREPHTLPVLCTCPSCPAFLTQVHLPLETVLPAKGQGLSASEQILPHRPPVSASPEVQANSQAFL